MKRGFADGLPCRGGLPRWRQAPENAAAQGACPPPRRAAVVSLLSLPFRGSPPLAIYCKCWDRSLCILKRFVCVGVRVCVGWDLVGLGVGTAWGTWKGGWPSSRRALRSARYPAASGPDPQAPRRLHLSGLLNGWQRCWSGHGVGNAAHVVGGVCLARVATLRALGPARWRGLGHLVGRRCVPHTRFAGGASGPAWPCHALAIFAFAGFGGPPLCPVRAPAGGAFLFLFILRWMVLTAAT